MLPSVGLQPYRGLCFRENLWEWIPGSSKEASSQESLSMTVLQTDRHLLEEACLFLHQLLPALPLDLLPPRFKVLAHSDLS